MKAAPLLVAWHNESAPVYSVQFDPRNNGRLATAGGDNNARLWRVEEDGENRKITYLATLAKHTQAVNVVRWCPKGEMLATAGDDSIVLMWIATEHRSRAALGNDTSDDKETWMVKRMCGPIGKEIYDLAWSPDGSFFVTGSMDNVARIFDAETGSVVRQIAEHNHYVQGVSWDPLNEYLATQSSDRSVHVYKLSTNDGQFSLSQHGRISRMDLPPRRRRTSNSPAPPDFGQRGRLTSDASSHPAASSPVPSAPGTPASMPQANHAMPPPASQSRRSSCGASSPSIRRSASPAPSMPLPAVMPSVSPRPLPSMAKNSNIYANETLTSFFRRLTFAPDGSLLFTPAGQYRSFHHAGPDHGKSTDEVTNTVYIYSRAGLNKPPIAHLPGHKKPSIAVKCSPIYYNLRLPTSTKQLTVDTSAAGDGDIPPLPEPAVAPKAAPSSHPSKETFKLTPSDAQTPPTRPADSESSTPPAGPQAAFALPYRIVYAVATQDAVYVYDTQQQTPICVVSNLHYATFTDLTWSSDGKTLLMSSSDGFCSALSFSSGELGSTYHGTLNSRIHAPSTLNPPASTHSAHSTPSHTPTVPTAAASHHKPSSSNALHPGPSPSPYSSNRACSPPRSNSASSNATQQSSAFPPPPISVHGSGGASGVVNNPAPTMGNLPSIAATNTSGSVPQFASPTPPMTPFENNSAADQSQSHSQAHLHSGSAVLSAKRPSESVASSEEPSPMDDTEKEGGAKRRRIAPTLVSSADADGDGGDQK
ncbi:MAG: hypothetical protein M1831_005380 [Alyxoria varia]|nr:MAG: hypothetical protein M1831_005380 [Alyxoria varia]